MNIYSIFGQKRSFSYRAFFSRIIFVITLTITLSLTAPDNALGIYVPCDSIHETTAYDFLQKRDVIFFGKIRSWTPPEDPLAEGGRLWLAEIEVTKALKGLSTTDRLVTVFLYPGKRILVLPVDEELPDGYKKLDRFSRLNKEFYTAVPVSLSQSSNDRFFAADYLYGNLIRKSPRAGLCGRLAFTEKELHSFATTYYLYVFPCIFAFSLSLLASALFFVTRSVEQKKNKTEQNENRAIDLLYKLASLFAFLMCCLHSVLTLLYSGYRHKIAEIFNVPPVFSTLVGLLVILCLYALVLFLMPRIFKSGSIKSELCAPNNPKSRETKTIQNKRPSQPFILAAVFVFIFGSYISIQTLKAGVCPESYKSCLSTHYKQNEKYRRIKHRLTLLNFLEDRDVVFLGKILSTELPEDRHNKFSWKVTAQVLEPIKGVESGVNEIVYYHKMDIQRAAKTEEIPSHLRIYSHSIDHSSGEEFNLLAPKSPKWKNNELIFFTGNYYQGANKGLQNVERDYGYKLTSRADTKVANLDFNETELRFFARIYYKFFVSWVYPIACLMFVLSMAVAIKLWRLGCSNSS